jgi:hypothetical protein
LSRYEWEQLLLQEENPLHDSSLYRLKEMFRHLFRIRPSERNNLRIKEPHMLMAKNPNIPYDVRRDYVLHHRCKILDIRDPMTLIKLGFTLISMDQCASLETKETFSYWTYFWLFIAPTSCDNQIAFRKAFFDIMFLLRNTLTAENMREVFHMFEPFRLTAKPFVKVFVNMMLRFQQCALLTFDSSEQFCQYTDIETIIGKNIYPEQPSDFLWHKCKRLPWASKEVRRALLEAKECLFIATNYSTDSLQPSWICLTCELGTCTNHCLCHNCALRCHKGHKLMYVGVFVSWCDCYDCTC